MDVQSLSMAVMFEGGAEEQQPTAIPITPTETFVLPKMKQMQNKMFDPSFDAPSFPQKGIKSIEF
jgi:hypothetical protein